MGFFVIPDKRTVERNNEFDRIEETIRKTGALMTHVEISPYGWTGPLSVPKRGNSDVEVVGHVVMKHGDSVSFLTFSGPTVVSQRQEKPPPLHQDFVIGLMRDLHEKYRKSLCGLNLQASFLVGPSSWMVLSHLLHTNLTPRLLCIDLTGAGVWRLRDIIQGLYANCSTRVVKLVVPDGSEQKVLRRFQESSQQKFGKLNTQVHIQTRTPSTIIHDSFLCGRSLDSVVTWSSTPNISSKVDGMKRNALLEVGPPLNQTKAVVMHGSNIVQGDVSIMIGKFHGHFHMDVSQHMLRLEIKDCSVKTHQTMSALASAVGRMPLLEVLLLEVKRAPSSWHLTSSLSDQTIEAISHCRYLKILHLHTNWMELTARHLDSIVINVSTSLVELSLLFHSFQVLEFRCRDWITLGDEINGGRLKLVQFEYKRMYGNPSPWEGDKADVDWKVLVATLRLCVARNRLSSGKLDGMWDSAALLLRSQWAYRAHLPPPTEGIDPAFMDVETLPTGTRADITEESKSTPMSSEFWDRMLHELSENWDDISCELRDASVFFVCARERLLLAHQVPDIIAEHYKPRSF